MTLLIPYIDRRMEPGTAAMASLRCCKGRAEVTCTAFTRRCRVATAGTRSS